MSKKINGTPIVPEKEKSAFEKAEQQRYEKLAVAPEGSFGKKCPKLNLDGTNHKEILGL